MEQYNETSEKSFSAAEPLAARMRGVLLPFTTPFTSPANVDECAVRQNISDWSKQGIAGYIALGSTGERVHLNDYECVKVIETARSSVPAQTTLIVGAGQQSTRATVDEIRRFAEAGAEAVLVITPHFYRAEMTQGVLAKHYLEVADASPVPVVLYSVPQFTNVTIQPETIARLSEHENIVGVKDSSGDVVALAETVRLVPEGFAVLTGNGSALYPALCVGARGGILAVGCVAPRLAVEVYEAFGAGEHERARAAQARLARVTRGVLGRYGISGLKAALDMLGYAGGRVRAPLQDATEEARREIEKVLRETGLLGQEEKGAESLSAGASRE